MGVYGTNTPFSAPNKSHPPPLAVFAARSASINKCAARVAIATRLSPPNGEKLLPPDPEPYKRAGISAAAPPSLPPHPAKGDIVGR